MWRGLVLVFVLGCLPAEIAPRHARTMAICGWQPASVDEVHVDPPEAHLGCVDALLRDLAVDEPSFAGAERELVGVLDAARALAVGDLGEEVPVALEDPLAPIAEVTGGSTPAELLYDWVTARVERTVLGHDPGLWASFDEPTGTLTVHAVLEGLDGAAILVHEARHGDGAVHTPCRGDPQQMCDDGVAGAYGAQLAYHRLVRERARDPTLREAQDAAVSDCLERIQR